MPARLSDAGIRIIFTDNEYDQLIERIQVELLPRLAEIRIQWEYDHSSSDSPEGGMGPLLNFLQSLLEGLGKEQGAAEAINRQLVLTNEWIEENRIHWPDRSPRQLGNMEPTHRPESTRSIFDDIDSEE